jgi:hypothetical protein
MDEIAVNLACPSCCIISTLFPKNVSVLVTILPTSCFLPFRQRNSRIVWLCFHGYLPGSWSCQRHQIALYTTPQTSMSC